MADYYALYLLLHIEAHKIIIVHCLDHIVSLL